MVLCRLHHGRRHSPSEEAQPARRRVKWTNRREGWTPKHHPSTRRSKENDPALVASKNASTKTTAPEVCWTSSASNPGLDSMVLAHVPIPEGDPSTGRPRSLHFFLTDLESLRIEPRIQIAKIRRRSRIRSIGRHRLSARASSKRGKSEDARPAGDRWSKFDGTGRGLAVKPGGVWPPFGEPVPTREQTDRPGTFERSSPT